MSNDELKKKFIKIIRQGFADADCRRPYTNVPYPYFDSQIFCIADALIAAGIGDVKEAERRAEVAERALRNAAPRLKCRGGWGKGFCRVDNCEYYHCNNDEGCIKAHLEQAEKELAEE